MCVLTIWMNGAHNFEALYNTSHRHDKMYDMIDARWAIYMMKRRVNDKCTIDARFMHHLRTIYARFLHDERNARVVHVYRLVVHDNRQGLMHDNYN